MWFNVLANPSNDLSQPYLFFKRYVQYNVYPTEQYFYISHLLCIYKYRTARWTAFSFYLLCLILNRLADNGNNF